MKPAGSGTLVLGGASLVLVFAALYFFGSHELWSRLVGVGLVAAAAICVLVADRLRVRTSAGPTAKSRGPVFLAVFVLLGLVGFFLPGEQRRMMARFLYYLIKKL